MERKIVIIGAGPVGCFAAQALKKKGFNPTVLEEHQGVGKPVHCTGLVGNRLFSESYPFTISKNAIINTINGAIIHFDGDSFTLKRENVAYVVDREKFDKELSSGLDIHYENKFIGLEKEGEGYCVETDKDEIYADIVIGADGASSSVRKCLNDDTNIKHYKGLQLRMQHKIENQDLVEVFLHKSDFFWIVPEGKDVVRVGVISENPHNDLQEFQAKFNIKGKILEKFGGIVSLGMCQETSKNNIALVGGAACQVKPLSYGGVYFGIQAASILADVIGNGKLNEYDSLWKGKLASEIKIGLRLKEIYSRLSYQEQKNLFSILKSHKSVIERLGDFENHSSLILDMLKNPRLYLRVGDLLPILLKSVI